MLDNCLALASCTDKVVSVMSSNRRSHALTEVVNLAVIPSYRTNEPIQTAYAPTLSKAVICFAVRYILIFRTLFWKK